MSTPTVAPPPPWTLKHATSTPRERDLLARAIEAEKRVWALFSVPVAAALVDNLKTYVEWGWRFDTGGRTQRLVDDILARPLPEKT